MLRTNVWIVMCVLGLVPLQAHPFDVSRQRNEPVARVQAPGTVLNHQPVTLEKEMAPQQASVVNKATARQQKRARDLEKKALRAQQKRQGSGAKRATPRQQKRARDLEKKALRAQQKRQDRAKNPSLFSKIVNFLRFNKKGKINAGHQKREQKPLSLAKKAAAHSGSEPFVVSRALLSEKERAAYLNELFSPGAGHIVQAPHVELFSPGARHIVQAPHAELFSPGAGHIVQAPHVVREPLSFTRRFQDANGQIRLIKIMSWPANAAEDQAFRLEW